MTQAAWVRTSCHLLWDARLTRLRTGSIVNVATTPLADVLDDAGAPHYIDFLSLDISGAELGVLKSMDYDRCVQLPPCGLAVGPSCMCLAGTNSELCALRITRTLPRVKAQVRCLKHMGTSAWWRYSHTICVADGVATATRKRCLVVPRTVSHSMVQRRR